MDKGGSDILIIETVAMPPDRPGKKWKNRFTSYVTYTVLVTDLTDVSTTVML